MRDARFWIEHLGLEPHPEGGYYRQSYKSGEIIDDLPERYAGPRAFSTAIYFLLQHPNFSAFHRIASDELWHFYAGSPLTVWIISPEGALSTLRLGPNPEQGQSFQGVSPAGSWFASAPDEPGSWALVGCTVAPGFDFADFELAERDKLAAEYPQHRELIERLTRG
ncbi:MAG: hypothetical protein C4332_04720 [Meiothermus sp.]